MDVLDDTRPVSDLLPVVENYTPGRSDILTMDVMYCTIPAPVSDPFPLVVDYTPGRIDILTMCECFGH